MLTQNDIETQLTQRRLDVQALQLSLNQLKAQINQFSTNSQFTTLQDQVNTIQSTVNALNPGTFGIGSLIFGLITIFKAAVTFSAVTTFNALATFTAKIKANLIGINTTPTYLLDIAPASPSTATQVHIASTAGTDDGAYITGLNTTPAAIFSAGAIFNGTNWVAKNAYATIISLSSSGFIIYVDSGLTPGNTYAPTQVYQLTGTQMGFWGASIASKQTLNSYTSNGQGSGYSGIASGVGGSPYAAVSDLNTLRVAYENLRSSYDDLRTKLRTSTLVG